MEMQMIYFLSHSLFNIFDTGNSRTATKEPFVSIKPAQQSLQHPPSCPEAVRLPIHKECRFRPNSSHQSEGSGQQVSLPDIRKDRPGSHPQTASRR